MRRRHPVKGTVRDILASSEFVVNLVPLALAEAMNLAAVDPVRDRFTWKRPTGATFPEPAHGTAAPDSPPRRD